MLTARLITTDDTVVADLEWWSASVRHEMMGEGGWELKVPATQRLLGLLEARTEQYWMLLIDHATGFVHGGPLRRIGWKGVGTNAEITLSGGNCNWYMNTVVVLPSVAQTYYPGVPPRAVRTYTRPQQYTSRSMYELVDDQINNTGLTYRADKATNSSLQLASLINVGNQISQAAEPFEPMLDTLYRWGMRGGVVADFQLKGASSTAEMFTRVPVERSFRLSDENGVLVDWTYEEEADTLSYAWVGGKGEGIDRPVIAVAGADTPVVPVRWGIPVERFVKASSATNAAEFIAAGQLKTADNTATSGIKTKALASRMGVEFGSDYQLGDRVGVVFNRVEYQQLITTVEIEWDITGKAETIETGEPVMWGQTLGRVTPLASSVPTAGLAVGYLKQASVFTVGDATVDLDLEIVYAAGDASVPAQATWAIERRIDVGAWTTELAAAALGADDIYYGHQTHTATIPAYTDVVEYRGVLAQTGETTVYSTIYAVGTNPALTCEFLSLVEQTVGYSNTLRCVIPDGQLTGTVLEVERSVSGSGTWAADPGTPDYTFTYAWPGGIFDRTVLHDTAGDFIYRFNLDPLVGGTVTSSESSVVTVVAAGTVTDPYTSTYETTY